MEAREAMRSQATGWLLLAPTLLILFVFGVLPFFYVLVTGFLDWNSFAADPTPRFAGVQNYRELVFDDQFLKSLWLTLRFAIFAVASELVLGYFLAQMFMRPFPGKGFFRTLHTLPLMVAPIAVGATWRLLTVPGLGPLPYYLEHWFGIDFRLGSFANQAFITTVIMDVWHWTPLVALLCFAGLRSIPDAYYQAARIDGASKFAVFRYIQLPKMRGVLMIAVLLRFMDSFMIYTEPFVLTGGGPGNATTFLSQYLTQKAVGQFDLGPAAAFSLIYFLIILLLCFILYNWMQALGTQDKSEVAHG